MPPARIRTCTVLRSGYTPPDSGLAPAPSFHSIAARGLNTKLSKNVPGTGLEPARSHEEPSESNSLASTNSANRAQSASDPTAGVFLLLLYKPSFRALSDFSAFSQSLKCGTSSTIHRLNVRARHPRNSFPENLDAPKAGLLADYFKNNVDHLSFRSSLFFQMFRKANARTLRYCTNRQCRGRPAMLSGRHDTRGSLVPASLVRDFLAFLDQVEELFKGGRLHGLTIR